MIAETQLGLESWSTRLWAKALWTLDPSVGLGRGSLGSLWPECPSSPAQEALPPPSTTHISPPLRCLRWWPQAEKNNSLLRTPTALFWYLHPPPGGSKYVPVLEPCLFNMSDVSDSILHALSLCTSFLFNLQEEWKVKDWREGKRRRK